MSLKMLTLTDVFEKLKRLDELTLLEILEISSEEIVDRFQDLIEDKYDQLSEELDEEEED